MSQEILKPGRIEPPAGEIPYLLLPERNRCFQRRAERLEALAPNHPLAGFLFFAARLARAQHQTLLDFPEVPLPDAHRLEACRQHGMPPLSGAGWRRDRAWRHAMRAIIADLREAAPDAARVAIDRLRTEEDNALEAAADDILSGEYASLDLAAAPFVGAALQVYWTHLASRLGPDKVTRNEIGALCPVCGSPPVASVVKTGAAKGLRYLHCSLCASEWNMVRVKCSNCESTKGIAYQAIVDGPPGVKAETCEECGSYLKIMFQDQDPHLEPVADDLATVALDLLLAEKGSQRSGPNLLLLPGAGQEA